MGDAGVPKGDGSQWQRTRRWRETQSPAAKGCFRFGGGKAGKDHGGDKRRSRDGEYRNRDSGTYQKGDIRIRYEESSPPGNRPSRKQPEQAGGDEMAEAWVAGSRIGDRAWACVA